MIDEQNLFDQPTRNDLTTYDNNASDCLLDCNYFKNYYKTITMGLSKQQALDPDPKAIQQITFTVNLEQSTIFFIIEEAKETVIDFSQGTVILF